jgi:hypothetical protein
MANKLYNFRCKYDACPDKDNFVELPEGESKRTEYLLYCSTCGRVVMSGKKEPFIDNFKAAWLPCIPYTGSEVDVTTGPVPDDLLGVKWGDASGGNLSEVEFMRQHGINPRVEWCFRKKADHPLYKAICKGKGQIKPVKYDYVLHDSGLYDSGLVQIAKQSLYYRGREPE